MKKKGISIAHMKPVFMNVLLFGSDWLNLRTKKMEKDLEIAFI